MSQRDSGYDRQERDLYETPAWVTAALGAHLPKIDGGVWEPAAGSGKMVRALTEIGLDVTGSDIEGAPSVDFLQTTATNMAAIITNPPYVHATEFLDIALRITEPQKGLVAFLLRTDFDHAKTRQWAFSRHPAFSSKIVLTKRIKWFEDSKGQPSFNHAWFIWDWRHRGAPTLAYGP